LPPPVSLAASPPSALACHFGNFDLQGKVEVQYLIGYSTTITFRRPPRNRRISSMGLPFREVFECLDFDNLITLFRCVLTEKQVRVLR
jgi:hypothetical protein